MKLIQSAVKGRVTHHKFFVGDEPVVEKSHAAQRCFRIFKFTETERCHREINIHSTHWFSFNGVLLMDRGKGKAQFPLPELTGDRFPLSVNMGRVDGRVFPLAEMTACVTIFPCWKMWKDLMPVTIQYAFNTMGHFIFRLNLSFKPKLKPKFHLKPKLIRKIKWRQSSI